MPRKYALSKLAFGDYICADNDRTFIYRFSDYIEGPGLGLDGWSRDRRVWRVRRCELATWSRHGGDPDEIEWDDYGDLFYFTRKAALADVFGDD